MSDWPKSTTTWIEGRTRYISVPFTWLLPSVLSTLHQRSMLYDNAIVGGPAVLLMPDYFRGMENVRTGNHLDGVLQRVNPQATRTTTGCVRTCEFCGIGTGKIEPGGLCELDDWPDLPVICDNNLLAASQSHFDRVLDRLERHPAGTVDFNQGLDARLLTPHHAERLALLKGAKIRLACDTEASRGAWERAVDHLRAAGVAKKRIYTYCLVGFQDTPQLAWDRCLWIERQRFYACPMWFHDLDAMRPNSVDGTQMACGWTERDRIDLMRYFYQHTGQPAFQEKTVSNRRST